MHTAHGGVRLLGHCWALALWRHVIDASVASPSGSTLAATCAVMDKCVEHLSENHTGISFVTRWRDVIDASAASPSRRNVDCSVSMMCGKPSGKPQWLFLCDTFSLPLATLSCATFLENTSRNAGGERPAFRSPHGIWIVCWCVV